MIDNTRALASDSETSVVVPNRFGVMELEVYFQAVEYFIIT